MFYTYAHYKPDNSVFYIGKGQCNRAFDKIGHVGHKHTDESKAKLSLAHTGKKQAPPNEETRKKLSESVKMSWIARRQKVRKEV